MKSFQTLSFINIQAYPHEFSIESVIPIKKKDTTYLNKKKQQKTLAYFST